MIRRFLQSRQCVKGCGGREQIRHWRNRTRREAAVWMRAREQPVTDAVIDWQMQVVQQIDHCCRWVCRSCFEPLLVRPCAVRCFEEFQTLDHTQNIRDVHTKVLIGAHRQKRGIRRAGSGIGHYTVPTVRRAVFFQMLKNFRCAGWFFFQRGPTSRETAKVNEIQIFACTEALQVSASPERVERTLERNQSLQTEDCIIQIAAFRTVLESTVRILLSKKELV